MRTTFLLSFLFIFTNTYSQDKTTLSSKTINKITEFVNSKREYYNSPSIAVAITDENNTIYLKHFGDAKKGDKYLIGSNSKSFTALLILILQEKEILNINNPVNKYLKWFEYKNKIISDKITLKDLLQHTSGINTVMGRTFLENNDNFDYANYYSKKLKILESFNLQTQPYTYSNVNYRLLGLIIETVTGKKYEECIKKFITQPMRLNSTSANVQPYLIDSYQYFWHYPILKFNENFHRQEIPSGLISSTASDMSVYLKNLMNSYNNNSITVLNFNIAKQLFTPNQNNKSRYGFGWRIVNDIFYHNGTNKSFESSMYILPSINKSIVVLINSNQAPELEIVDGIASILLNQKFNNKSSFPYYRNLPIVTFILFIILIIQFIKWKKNNFSIKLSRKIYSNVLLAFGVALATIILILLPGLNDVSLKTAIHFDPVSGYSIILISLLITLIFLLIYFNKKHKENK